MLSGHWVLWTKFRHKVVMVTDAIVFYNPMNNEATGTVKSLIDITIRTICSASDDHCIALEGRHMLMHLPTQPNGWDCVFYIMKTIQMLVEEFILCWTSPNFVSMIGFGCWMWILLILPLIRIW